MIAVRRFVAVSATCMLAGLILAVSAAHAQVQPVTVRIVPAAAQVAVDATLDLAVEVVDVQGLYGMDVSVTFDPAAVAVNDRDPTLPGVQVVLGTFLDPGFVIVNSADNDAGRLRLAMTQLNPSVAKSGTGNLIVIQLRGKQLGALSAITLVDVELAQRDGTILQTSLVPGQVEVVQSVAGPTNTPVPTQGPGTPFPTQAVSPTSTAGMSTATPGTGTPTATATATSPAATGVPVVTGTAAPPPVNPPGSTATPVPPAGTALPAGTLAPPAVATNAPPDTSTAVPPVVAQATTATQPTRGSPRTPVASVPAAGTTDAAGGLLVGGVALGGIVLGFVLALLLMRRRRPDR